MADSNYQIIFRIQCKACGQTLDPVISDEGVEYKHGNPADCEQPSVALPLITPEQLAVLFSKKKAAKKTASKKAKK